MDTYEVSLKGVSVGYDGIPLIHNINVKIKKGEILTLIGPNGAGKTTILKSITRQLDLLAGTVSYAGKSLEDMSRAEMAKETAVMLTDRSAEETMTCHDVAAMGRYPYTGRFGLLKEADEQKIEEALRKVHAEDLATRKFNEISDGQKQRVLLARALAQEPQVIILDEPTSYLDVRYKLELLSILRDLARQQQITVILSLHEIDLAQKISDTILCVKGETIFRYGTPEEIFTEEGIRELYDIEDGIYDPLFGNLELNAPVGEPEVFVLSGGNTGIPVYRSLQKSGTPFSAGILYPGDADYCLARHLAGRIITEKPYEPYRAETVNLARQEIQRCTRVIDAGSPTGSWDETIRALLKEAGQIGKLVRNPDRT